MKPARADFMVLNVRFVAMQRKHAQAMGDAKLIPERAHVPRDGGDTTALKFNMNAWILQNAAEV